MATKPKPKPKVAPKHKVAPKTKSPCPEAEAPKLSCAVRDWTERKREAFLAALALTSNVTQSAHAVNLSETGAYRLRRSDPAFRAAWATALSEGYARLEHMMLERAMTALSGEGTTAPDPARTRMAEYSNKLAMALLAAHRASVRGEGVRPASPKRKAGSYRPRLEARFAEMQARMGAADDSAE